MEGRVYFLHCHRANLPSIILLVPTCALSLTPLSDDSCKCLSPFSTLHTRRLSLVPSPPHGFGTMNRASHEDERASRGGRSRVLAVGEARVVRLGVEHQGNNETVKREHFGENENENHRHEHTWLLVVEKGKAVLKNRQRTRKRGEGRAYLRRATDTSITDNTNGHTGGQTRQTDRQTSAEREETSEERVLAEGNCHEAADLNQHQSDRDLKETRAGAHGCW